MRYRSYREVQGALANAFPGGMAISIPSEIVPDKALTRSGLKRFLMEVWDINFEGHYSTRSRILLAPHGPRSWIYLWDQTCWVRTTSRVRLHTVIPDDLWTHEKAMLAARIAAQPWGAEMADERRRALRWAQR